MTADWLPGSAGRLFSTQYSPPAASKRPLHGLLIVPPYGEEMNRSRRMMSLVARDAAVRGHLSLIVDLFGTGDSEGDFGEASIQQWTVDLATAARWLAGQGVEVLDVLSIRAGALLLEHGMFSDRLRAGRIVLWQPVTNGRQYANQLLRLKMAEGVIARAAGEGMAQLRERLSASGSIELAGYETSASLIAELEGRELTTALRELSRELAWYEVGLEDSPDLMPGSARMVAALRDGGATVESRTLHGEPFWATPEVATVPALIEDTLQYLSGSADA